MTIEKGFTLIELLVVVLIIGILAAVAVPQYQFAVIKSRASTLLSTLASLRVARDLYYLENGGNTLNTAPLVFSVPKEWKPIINTQVYAYGNDFMIDSSDNTILFVYCPGKANNYTQCWENQQFRVSFCNPSYATASICNPKDAILCIHSNQFGKKTCESLPGVKPIEE